MNRILILLCCCMLLGVSSQAQSALHHIPADVTAVMSLHPDAINKKLSLDKIKQMEFYEMLLQETSKSMSPGSREEVYKILKNPGDYGMDMRAGSHVFFKIDGKDIYMNYLFRISDKAKFHQVFNQHLNPGQAFEISQVNNYQMVQPTNEMAMAWSDEVLLVTYMMVMPSVDPYSFEDEYDLDDYSMEEETEIEEDTAEEEEVEPAPEEEVDEYALKAERTREGVLSWVERIMNLPASSSLISHPQHKRLASGSNDMIAWMNYEEVMGLYMDNMTNDLNSLGGGNPYIGMFF